MEMNVAKGCLSYAIETDGGAGWHTKVRIRDTPENIKNAFKRHARVTPKGVSIRLVRLHVIDQINKETHDGC